MEPSTFNELYELYAPDVFRFARYLTGREDWAEEILAETFFRAWTGRENLRVATAKAYLVAIARNLARDSQRRGQREAPLDFDARTPDAKPEVKRLLDQTMAAIQMLEERYRDPLVMHAIAELPYDEIARCLDLPLGTVKIRIHRARLQLNEILKRETIDEAAR